MSNLNLYTKATVYIDGSLLSEESKVSIKRTTGAQIAKTVAKGLAGVTPGSPMMEISISSAVPSADFELNPGKYMKLLQPTEVTIFAAGRTLTTKGFVMSDSFTHAVDSASALDMEITAQWTDWQ
jgi:hypothetical protein